MEEFCTIKELLPRTQIIYLIPKIPFFNSRLFPHADDPLLQETLSELAERRLGADIGGHVELHPPVRGAVIAGLSCGRGARRGGGPEPGLAPLTECCGRGKMGDGQDVLVRVHSECLIGGIFGATCQCGNQLELALKQIEAAGRGVLVYLRGNEGRAVDVLA
ncbi:hypothetical protein JHK85_010276 [Glycine max]|nr:hypothetical protein JHK85_010276 [Glycine max]